MEVPSLQPHVPWRQWCPWGGGKQGSSGSVAGPRSSPAHTLEHSICGPAKGTDTLTWSLVTLGFSVPPRLEDHLVHSSLQVPSAGLRIVPMLLPHCSQGHPAVAAPELDLPWSRAQLARDSSRLRAGLIPRCPVHRPPLYALTLGVVAGGQACQSCSIARKQDVQPEPGIRENISF